MPFVATKDRVTRTARRAAWGLLEPSSFETLMQEMICPQHFYKNFTTNPKCQVVIGCYC